MTRNVARSSGDRSNRSTITKTPLFIYPLSFYPPSAQYTNSCSLQLHIGTPHVQRHKVNVTRQATRANSRVSKPAQPWSQKNLKCERRSGAHLTVPPQRNLAPHTHTHIIANRHGWISNASGDRRSRRIQPQAGAPTHRRRMPQASVRRGVASDSAFSRTLPAWARTRA